MLGSFNASKTFLRICSLFSPCWLAMCERVVYLAQTASSLSQTVHLMPSSPTGKENFGGCLVNVSLSAPRGVVACWFSKTCRQARCLNRGRPSSRSLRISFSSCSHLVPAFHDSGALSDSVSLHLHVEHATYSPQHSRSSPTQCLALTLYGSRSTTPP